MKRRLVTALTLAAALPLSGCVENDPGCPALPGGGRYCLQPSGAMPAFEAQQKIEATFNGRRETLIVELEVDAAGLRFAGLTPFGHKVVQVAYDNRAASAAALPDARLDPALLAALVQLALWPTEAVRAGLQAPLRVDDGDGRRRISDGEATLLSVMRTGERPPFERLQISLPGAKLELDIETLPAATPGEGT